MNQCRFKELLPQQSPAVVAGRLTLSRCKAVLRGILQAVAEIFGKNIGCSCRIWVKSMFGERPVDGVVAELRLFDLPLYVVASKEGSRGGMPPEALGFLLRTLCASSEVLHRQRLSFSEPRDLLELPVPEEGCVVEVGLQLAEKDYSLFLSVSLPLIQRLSAYPSSNQARGPIRRSWQRISLELPVQVVLSDEGAAGLVPGLRLPLFHNERLGKAGLQRDDKCGLKLVTQGAR